MRSHFPSVATVSAFIVATIVPSGCSNGESLSGDQSDAAASGGALAITGGAAGTSGSSSGGGSTAGAGQGGASGSAAGGAANAAGGTNDSGGASANGGTTSGGAPAAGGATSGGASTTGGATNGGATNGGATTTGGAPSSGGSPDLIVTQIGLSPTSPTTGQAVTLSATVQNQGTAPTPAGTIVGALFSVDGTPVSWSDTHTQALAAGATITLTANGGPSNLATWTATSGSHQVLAFVDDIDRIPESNEGNNQLTLSVTVGGSCSPNCSGKVCGSDGCSGSCGTCGSGQSCNASGQCVTGSTVPSWNDSPPAGVSPAPSGSVVGNPGEFDTGPLASNEIWDNFDGAAGSKPDSRLWVLDTTNQGGTQTYDPARTFLDGAGNAVLEAIQNGTTVYSGRFSSRTKFNMRYGWCAARIKFPKAGQSWFPAFWMLHQGYNTNQNYGEIDIMEFFGNTKNYSTHIYITNNTLQSDKPVPANHSGGNAGDGYHTYWMQWESDRIQIGVDDLLMGDWGPTSVPAGAWDLAVTQPYYFIANFAVHPDWLPAPLATDFPARMLIDWIWYKPL